MTIKQALTGMMQLFAVFSFFALGFVCVCLPFAPVLRLQLVHFLLEDMRTLIWVGLAFFGLTLFLILGFYAVGKGRFLLLRMGDLSTEVDVKVLKKSIAPLFRQQFASRVRLSDVEVLKNSNLHIGLSLLPMEEKEKEKVLLDVDRHLQTLLSDRFGYRRPFTVQVKE